MQLAKELAFQLLSLLHAHQQPAQQTLINEIRFILSIHNILYVQKNSSKIQVCKIMVVIHVEP